ncbi:MAG TPA: DnaJ domain-containing protein, partial [Candidatus Tectomicrobia bacterium]|nr:DnaJ domain-containing protein [Candidatus Tectomicrobia bacterium]
MRRDYYAVLGIAATAPPREIRQAYRRLARQYSPDVNFWDGAARELFEEINEAYRVLIDPEARALYDRFGAGFGGALGVGRRGDDVHVSVDLDFAQAARGVSVDVAAPRFSPCPACRATGREADGAPCPPCQGRGV